MQLKTFMMVTLTVLGLLTMSLIVARINLSFQFKREVEVLFSQSNNISAKTFSYEQLSDLPEPVQRYFRHVLKDGQPYISYVRLTHDGQFKAGLDKDWTNIEGEQYFTTEKPGFVWKGTIFGATARDMYLSDKGRLVVTILSLFKIVEGKGEKYDEGELMRWLAESVWFPTNLLPSERLVWSSIDARSAHMSFNYNGLSLTYIVTFNEIGEITQMETRRFMDEQNKEIWLAKAADYKEMDGMIVPTKIEAIWKLEKGDLSYAKFNLMQIEYNKPEKF